MQCCRNRARRYYERNKERLSALNRLYAAANPDVPHKAHLKRLGVTPEQYQAVLSAQNGCCAICQADKPSGKGRWHVNRDRETGVFRGLLCHNCTLLLGAAKYTKQTLWRALDYLTPEKIPVLDGTKFPDGLPPCDLSHMGFHIKWP